MSFTVRSGCDCERCRAGRSRRGNRLTYDLNPSVCPYCRSSLCPHARNHGLECLQRALDRRPDRKDPKWDPPRMCVRRPAGQQGEHAHANHGGGAGD